eukprot:11345920-Karenia_brevis.AAC.1
MTSPPSAVGRGKPDGRESASGHHARDLDQLISSPASANVCSTKRETSRACLRGTTTRRSSRKAMQR